MECSSVLLHVIISNNASKKSDSVIVLEAWHVLGRNDI